MRSRRLPVLAAVLAVTASASLAFARDKPAWWHSTVTIENKSDYDITHLFLSPSDKAKWGKDWLGKDTFDKGDAVKLSGIECDTYDLKLIDEDGDVCIVEDIDLCLEDADWEINDDNLLKCQGWDKDD